MARGDAVSDAWAPNVWLQWYVGWCLLLVWQNCRLFAVVQLLDLNTSPCESGEHVELDDLDYIR